jgi:hypothetical protein
MNLKPIKLKKNGLENLTLKCFNILIQESMYYFLKKIIYQIFFEQCLVFMKVNVKSYPELDVDQIGEAIMKTVYEDKIKISRFAILIFKFYLFKDVVINSYR